MNEHFDCANGIGRPQTMTGCNGTCFQRGIFILILEKE